MTIKEAVRSLSLAGIPDQEPDRQNFIIEILRQAISQYTETEGRRPLFSIQTFGCQMNFRDSEKLEGILRKIGFDITDSEEADGVLYNTCTVRENANLRVYGRLGQMKRMKKQHPEMVIGLCGCMMQEPQVVEKIRTSYRHVNMIFGTHNLYKFAEILYNTYASDDMVVDIWQETDKIVEELPSKRKYSFKTGINIMFGCNNFCSYCIVPYVRGRERSRRPVDIIREIEAAVADGVTEVMLLGQNVNSYGKNLEEPVTFAQLLREIEKIEGLQRIRFMTSHPKDLSDELIEVMASSKKICRHLHLPVQSGSSRLLADMNRHYTKESYLALVEKIRAAMPDISLTTDIIVGYPGETEEDHQDTMDVIRKCRYDSAFTFIYSRRSGTPAARRTDQIPDEIVHDRFDRLLALTQEIGAKTSSRFTGTIQEVLVEERNDHDPGMVTGRMSQNLLVHFKGDPSLIGQIVRVRLCECKGFYYIGELCP